MPCLQKSLQNLFPCTHQLQLRYASSHPSVHDDPIHNVSQSFVSRTIFTNPHLQPLSRNFTISSGTDFFWFDGPYEGSQKQPDVLVKMHGFYWPSLVVETGWTEDHSDLVEDAKLWLLGSGGGSPGGAIDLQQPVNAVILIFFDRKNFEADNSSLKGYLEVWRCDPANANAIKCHLSTHSGIHTRRDRSRNQCPSRRVRHHSYRFDLMYLANRVRSNVGYLIMGLPVKRRIKTVNRQEEENATRTEEQQRTETDVLRHEESKRIGSELVD